MINMERWIEFDDEYLNRIIFENQGTEFAIGTDERMYYLNREQFKLFKEWLLKQELNFEL